jgi:HSP90 family molecular chaperone
MVNKASQLETNQTTTCRYPDFSKNNFCFKFLDTSNPRPIAETIWTRDPADVEEDELLEFYKTLTRDPDIPMAFKFVKGRQTAFKGLLFVSPSLSPKRSGVQLYIQGIHVQDNCEDLVPVWLNFMKGLVDFTDLPREQSQQSKILRGIREELTKYCVDLFEKLSKNKDEFKTFYNLFSNNLKLGAHGDSANRTKLSDLLRFTTSVSDGALCSLSDIASRLKPNQNHINFIRKSQIEYPDKIKELAEQGVEVVYLVEPIDEFVIKKLKNHQGNQLVVFEQTGVTQEFSDGGSEVETPESVENGVELSDGRQTILPARIRQIGEPGVFFDSERKLHVDGFVYRKQKTSILTKSYRCMNLKSMLCTATARVYNSGQVLTQKQHVHGTGKLIEKFPCELCGKVFLSAEREAKHHAIHTAPVS